MSRKQSRSRSPIRSQIMNRHPIAPVSGPPQPQAVLSLLDAMVEGNEFASIVGLFLQDGDVVRELRRSLAEIEAIRSRPCLCYVANVVKQDATMAIDLSDDLPFNEMVSLVDPAKRDADVLIVTPGGLGAQVSQFVNTLRQRFDSVEFILPERAMSAGTLWALSGDRIWMDSRAFIGPIDPQVRLKDGQFVSAQSVLILLDKIRQDGEAALRRGENPPWTLIRLVDNMDPRLIGDAMSQSNYSITMATDFLRKYKFSTWTHRRSTGEVVTQDMKTARAQEIAGLLCSNERWKSHGHGITRDVANQELQLVIDHLEDQAGLQRAVRRFWALLYYLFDKTYIGKLFISQQYALFRVAPNAPTQTSTP